MTIEKIRENKFSNSNESIYNFSNEHIEFLKEQQLNMLERIKTSSEMSEFHHLNFMKNPSPELEKKALKAFEFYAYDKFNLDLLQKQELIERLRIADELLKSKEKLSE